MLKNTHYLNLINEKLDSYFPEKSDSINTLNKAMKYTLSLPGKRVRPILALEFCRALGGKIEECLPFACAIEMVHNYSLIHDDLPCMDDDDLRREKPTNHKVFGEAMALLAGDGLLNLAFEIMLSEETVALVGEKRAILASRVLANACGRSGMILGQVIDLESENKSISMGLLKTMHINKTAKLISAACEIGGIIAGAKKEQLLKTKKYGLDLGLAFQIMDDILDADQNEENINLSDKENGKATYVTMLGLEKSKKLVINLTKNAIENISFLKDNGENLRKIAIDLSQRIS